jgi:AcrR family transcriptional regulator
VAGLAALAAFELARERGLANVRVPEIARAAGVSTRTFNNYFASKERAIAWPAGRHAAGMALALRGRPADEPPAEALVEVVAGRYRPVCDDARPTHWLRDFRSLVACEPALHGEYLTAMAVAERELAGAIAARMPAGGLLRARVLAAMVAGAEIGAQLFLSPRTVERHLSKVFGKLGISSRKELRAALSDVGAAVVRL